MKRPVALRYYSRDRSSRRGKNTPRRPYPRFSQLRFLVLATRGRRSGLSVATRIVVLSNDESSDRRVHEIVEPVDEEFVDDEEEGREKRVRATKR